MNLVITLPETPERAERCKQHLLDMQLDSHFITGIHAKTFGLMTHHTYDFDHPSEGYRIPAKHVGLFLSHYMCWQIASMNQEPTLIMEDDVFFERQPYAILEELKNYLNEWDMIFVGSGNTFDKPHKQVFEHLYEVQYPQCTHAYLISQSAAKRLLLEQRKCFAPIDLSLIHVSLPTMKVLTFLPRLASQYGQNINH